MNVHIRNNPSTGADSIRTLAPEVYMMPQHVDDRLAPFKIRFGHDTLLGSYL